MALDPRIALMGRGLDVGATFGNVLDNLGKAQQLKRDRALLPLEEQLKQAQIGNQQEVLTANELANNKARRDQYFSSVAQFGAEILPSLESNDISGALGSLQRRRADLVAQGLPTETTDEAIELAQTNPELLKQRAMEAVQLGRQMGVFGGQQSLSASQKGQARTVRKGDKLFSQQEVFNPNTGSIDVVETPIEGELVQRSTGLTSDERVNLAGQKQQLVGDIKVGQDVRSAYGVTSAKGDALASTPIGSVDLESKIVKLDETKAKSERERSQIIAAKESALSEANGAISTINNLITGDRFEYGFGKVVANTPDTLKSQDSLDVIAELDQIRGLVSLESRNKLKGQGTISDSESKTLEQSATVLSNPLISSGLAKKELKKIKKVFERSAKRNKLSNETREQRISNGQQAPVQQGSDNSDPLGLR